MEFGRLLVRFLIGFALCHGHFPEVLVAASNQNNMFTQQERKYLMRQFAEKDYSPRFLARVFQSRKLRKFPAIVRQNIVNRVSPDRYNDFMSPYSINKAVQFSRKWRTVLTRASRKFRVEKEILVAILLVETGLGTVMGHHHIASIFASIVIEYRNRIRNLRSSPAIDKRGRYELDRLRMKDRWARKEMASLLKIVKRTKHDPFHFKGSYAGAFGIPQFLPSSYLKWGFDADNNGTVNLYWFPDAIYSVGNYLKSHGWKPELPEKEKRDVIWTYNHSKTYVDTVLFVARKIGYRLTEREIKTHSQL